MKDLTLTTEVLREANIPKRFWSLGSDTYYANPAALKKVELFARSYMKGVLTTPTGMYIYGPGLTAKTFLLTYVLRLLMVQSTPCFYLTMSELPGRLFGEDSADFKTTCSQCFVIAIDDLEEPNSVISFRGITRFFSWCSDNGISLLFASQMSPSELVTTFRREMADFLHDVVPKQFEIRTSVDVIAREEISRRKNKVINVD